MYGAAESWALAEAQGAWLETFRNACLRWMLGLRRGPFYGHHVLQPNHVNTQPYCGVSLMDHHLLQHKLHKEAHVMALLI